MKTRLTTSVGLFALASIAAGCGPNIPTSEEAGVSYATTEVDWPATVGCIDDETVAVAKEMLSTENLLVVIARGENEIPDSEWDGYWPSSPFVKNSTRNLEFVGSCFWRSPGTSEDCEGETCETVIEHDAYTWTKLSQIVSADCVPADGACGFRPGDGQLGVIVATKCHEIVFRGDVVELVGPAGERAVMHATADGTPDLGVSLPAGWSLETRTLEDDLVLRPFGEGGDCFYNIIRDAKEQSYHQYRYAGESYP